MLFFYSFGDGAGSIPSNIELRIYDCGSFYIDNIDIVDIELY